MESPLDRDTEVADAKATRVREITEELASLVPGTEQYERITAELAELLGDSSLLHVVRGSLCSASS